MKRCDKQNKFPNVKAGDTVEFVAESEIYLVCMDRTSNKLALYGLHNGMLWSTHSLWGTREPNEFRKVTCCYTVEA